MSPRAELQVLMGQRNAALMAGNQDAVRELEAKIRLLLHEIFVQEQPDQTYEQRIEAWRRTAEAMG